MTTRRSLRSSPFVSLAAIAPVLSDRAGIERSAVRVRSPGAAARIGRELCVVPCGSLRPLLIGGVALRIGACSALSALGGDASGTLVAAELRRRISSAEDRVRPPLRQKLRPTSALGAFARSSAPLPEIASATPFRAARHSVCVVPMPSRGHGRSFLVRWSEGVNPPSPLPRFVPLNFFKAANWGEDLSTSFLQSSFQSASTTVNRRSPSLDVRPAVFAQAGPLDTSSGAVSLSLPGQDAICSARAAPTTSLAIPT